MCINDDEKHAWFNTWGWGWGSSRWCPFRRVHEDDQELWKTCAVIVWKKKQLLSSLRGLLVAACVSKHVSGRLTSARRRTAGDGGSWGIDRLCSASTHDLRFLHRRTRGWGYDTSLVSAANVLDARVCRARLETLWRRLPGHAKRFVSHYPTPYLTITPPFGLESSAAHYSTHLGTCFSSWGCRSQVN